MSRILLRAALRYHLRHPWQLTLALLGVTLGVAVVTAVDIAAGSARRAFTVSTEAVSGRATHEILGGPGGVPESVYTRLRTELGVDSVAPVLDRLVQVQTATAERVIRLLGIDPFAERPIRPDVVPAGQLDFSMLLTRPAVLLTSATAAQLGVSAGDTVQLTSGIRTSAVVVAALLEPGDALTDRGLADVALADVATAQEVTGVTGALDRIELRISDDAAGRARAAAVAAALPAGMRLVETAVRTGATARLTRAFETNLTALALVALVFGMFLIYNSVNFSLVQRRPLLGLLRAQGVTAGELLRLVLAEAAVLGAAASALGLLAGTLLGSRLVGLVTRTVNDLYFTISVAATRMEPLLVLQAVMLGIGATVLAAWPPAREATRTPPGNALSRAGLERTARSRGLRGVVPGVAALAAAAALLAIPSRSVVLGFSALFVLILGAALLTPAATILSAGALTPLLSRCGAIPRMAVRAVPASLSRTAPAIAALSVALAVGLAVTIMIGSFRSGVLLWLDRSLPADLYISAPDFGAGRSDVTLDPSLPARITGLAGVAGISTYRHTSLLLDGDFAGLIAVELDPRHNAAFELLDRRALDAWAEFDRGSVLVSEPLAFRRGITAGDSLAIPTDRGDVHVHVAAVFRDYASEHGVMFMDRRAYDRLFDDRAVSSVAVFVNDGASADAVLEAVRSMPAATGTVARSNQALRESTIVVFDRTFAITGVLRLLALIVAFVGVTGALMALQLERAKEIGVLRTTGLTRGQVGLLVTVQTALMGLIAAALAAPLGLAMAGAMVHVINRRSFGWTFEMVVGGAPFLHALAVGLGAAVIGGMYPAWRMALMQPVTALREE